MHKFPIFNYSKLDELPFADLNEQKFSVYIVDFNWNYIFVNEFACNMLHKTQEELHGRNMWQVYAELQNDASFAQLRRNTEENIISNITTVSPVTGERISITSYPLQDCYYFSVSILPKKDNLLNELRKQLKKPES